MHRANVYLRGDCPIARFGGRYAPPRDFGAWTFCPIANGSTIFSVGIGNDATFDTTVLRRFGARVSCFDPTLLHREFEELLLDSKRGANPPLSPVERSLIRFFPFGLAANDDVLQFWRNPKYTVMASALRKSHKEGQTSIMVPVLRMKTLMQVAGVKHVDVLKVDIEGSEYGLFSHVGARAWLGDARFAPLQINVEFHGNNLDVPANRSKNEYAAMLRATELNALRSCGYMVRYQHSDDSWLMVRAGPPTQQCTGQLK